MEKYGRTCKGFSQGAGYVGIPGLVASPSPKIYKIVRLNAMNDQQRIEEYFGSSLIPSWLFSVEWPHHTSFYKGVDGAYVWRPLVIKEGLPEYSIYYSIVNRVDYLERLCLERPSTLDEKWHQVEKSLRAVQDRYQLLMIHMTLKNHFKNKQLTEGVPISPLAMFSPGDNLEFSINELPDLFALLLSCGFWGDHVDIPYRSPRGSSSFTDDEMETLIFDLTKVIPRACKCRAFTSSLANGWLKRGYTSIFQCVLRMIMASLLGVYEHSKVVASFQVRQKLYKWFSLMPPSGEELAEWIAQNKFLILYILREYLFWSIKYLPALYDFLGENYYLSSVINNTFDSMDTVRRRLNHHVFEYYACHPLVDDMNNSLFDHFLNEGVFQPFNCLLTTRKQWQLDKPWFTWADYFLDQANKENPDNWPRVIEMSFAECMNSYFDDFDVLHFYSEKVPWIDIDAEKKLLDIIFSRVKQWWPISYWFLGTLPFSVHADSIRELASAEDLYQRETSRSGVKKTLDKILRRGARDYLILRHFFQCLKRRQSILVYPLPRDWTDMQIKKFHQLYQTKPGETLPEQAGLYMACVNCSSIRSITIPYEVDDEKQKKLAKQRKSSLCCDGIRIDLDTGKLYCSQAKSKNNSKKRTSSSISSLASDTETEDDEQQDDDEDMMEEEEQQQSKTTTRQPSRMNEREQKKKAKHSREKENASLCPRTELVEVNMIGTILKLKKMIVVLCPYCLSVMRFSRNCFETYGGVFSCGCQKLPLPTIPCTLCGTETKENINRNFFLVFDDENTTRACVRKMPFCSDAGCTWIKSWETFLPLSLIRRSYAEGWYTSRSSSGERVFKPRDTNRASLYAELRSTVKKAKAKKVKETNESV